MSTNVSEGAILWRPPEQFVRGSEMTRYMDWLAGSRGQYFTSYDELWRWSVEDLPAFWASVWEFYRVTFQHRYSEVLSDQSMPGARWFVDSTVNYAEQIFRTANPDSPAIIFQSERHPLDEMSWKELRDQVASVAWALRNMGVGRGDRVAGYLPNTPHGVIALLASASIGAIWSSCSPDFGIAGVVERFKQIEPVILFAVDGYQYNGKSFDRLDAVREIQEALPTLRQTILIPYLDPTASPEALRQAASWDSMLHHTEDPRFEPVPFDHPLWILYSSGTTGLPKPIVQGHGGIMMEHLKVLGLHHNLKPRDRFFWYTTTGWMMWNLLVGGLLVGSSIVLYDGSPAYPDLDVLWDLADASDITYFGASASYITSCLKAGLKPGASHDLSTLLGMGSTGSPLSVEGFAWVYENVKDTIWLGSVSGGTDVCTAFLGCCPLLPVRAGELQCRCLGADVQAFDLQGQPVIGEVGELVITKPMPSMPLFFWNDAGGSRYHDSYYATYEGVWRHGDWIKVTAAGGVVIYGRSDSTLNRMGVRMGSSEIYSAVEELPEVVDSLIIGLERRDGGYFMPLFVVLSPDTKLDDELIVHIRERIRAKLSPRHVPDAVYVIDQVPRTLSGKKLEVPIKKILMGVPVEQAANPGSMKNPDSLQYFVDMAQNLFEGN